MSYNNLNQLTARSGSGATLPVHFRGTVNEYSTVTVTNQLATLLDTNYTFAATVNLPPGRSEVPVVATALNGDKTTNNFSVYVTGEPGKTYAYDPNGNCTNVSMAGTNIWYEWDAEDRLTAINTYVTNTATWLRSEFTYDGFDHWAQIIEKINGVPESTSRFVWCGPNLCQARDGANNVQKRFFAEGEQIAGANYYFVRDQLGSVQDVVDAGNFVRARYEYDPYGKQTEVQGNMSSDFGFAGYYQHAPSGLYLTVYRAYDPLSGRWLNRDPIGENGGLNLYDYVDNDPINEIDLLGLDDLNLYPPGSVDAKAADTRGTSPSQFTVGGHGNERTVVDGRSGTLKAMSDSDLANLIKSTKGYTPDKPVRLYNCEAGKGNNSPAQRLSSLIPNPVIAASESTSEKVYTDKNGNVVKSDAPQPINGGVWRTFQGGQPK